MSDSLSSIKGFSELETYHNDIVNMSSKLPDLTLKVDGVVVDTTSKFPNFLKNLGSGISDFVGSVKGKVTLGLFGAAALCAGVFVFTKGGKND